MKKFIVKPYELNAPLDPNGQLATITAPKGAKLLKAILGAKPATPALISVPGQNPQQQIMLVPVFMFECGLDQEDEEREFLIIPPNKPIEDDIYSFDFCDSLLYPDGKLFFVYERS